MEAPPSGWEEPSDVALEGCVLMVCVCVCSQGDCRSYSYVCGVTSRESPHWDSLLFLARLIPRMCHNINR